MFTETGGYLSENGLAIGISFCFWIILFDEKTLCRLRKSKIKQWMHLPVIIFFLQIILGIIKIIRKY
jgi:heme A synthase